MKTKLSKDMNIVLAALVRRIKQRAYLDTDEEIARWIEEYCEHSNSHKQVVMQAEGSDGAEGAAVAGEGEPKAVCGDCGVTLTLVRPGKYQCDNIVCISNQ